MNTVAEAADLVRSIDHPNLRTMIDCSAAGLTETDPVPALIDRWLPTGLIAHLQVNDPNRRGPGQGEMKFAPILAALKRHNYAGTIAVEPFDYLPDGPGVAAFSAGYLRGPSRGFPVNRAVYSSPQRGGDVAAVDGGDIGGGLQRQRLGQERLRDILGRDFPAEQIAPHIGLFADAAEL